MATKKDLTLLGLIVAAMQNEASPFHFATEKDVATLVKEGLVETNAEITDGDKIAARATDAGIAANSPAPAAGGATWPTGGASAAEGTPPAGEATGEAQAPAEPVGDHKRTTGGFLTGAGFVPAEKKGVTRRGRNLYNFEDLEVGGFVFVPASAEVPNPAKKLVSVVSSATKRFAEETGETKVTAKGNTIPVLKTTRKFNIQPVTGGVAYGSFTAPADGAVIYRSA